MRVWQLTMPENLAMAASTLTIAPCSVIDGALMVALALAWTSAVRLLTLTAAAGAETVTPSVSEIVTVTPATVFSSILLGSSWTVMAVPDLVVISIRPFCGGALAGGGGVFLS